jgi:hypothetical protein
VQDSLLDADRAIAIDHRKIGRDAEAHATAVAPAFHGQHGVIAFHIIRARPIVALSGIILFESSSRSKF